nr:hypothetical protein [Tessaracoccus coleopterorum]
MGKAAERRLDLVVLDGAAGLPEEPGPHDRLGAQDVAAHEALLQVDPAVVEAEHPRLQREPLPERERPPVRDRLTGHHRIPATGGDRLPEARTQHEIHPAQVEQREVLAVVHVPQHVEVGRHHAEGGAGSVPQLERAAAA